MRYKLLSGLILVLHAPVHAQVDRIIQPWNTNRGPGMAVAVLHQDEILHHEGHGMANLEHEIPISSTSVFDVASVSKQFCAFAIAMLVDEGSVSLDEDIRTYLPELPDFGHVVTVRHLIYHTSGLRDWPGMLALSGRSMEDVISMKEILHFVKRQQTLNFTPGTQYSYSNTGYNLLALLIERISGQSFRSFMNDEIFVPLGMTQTYFQDDHEEILPGRVTSYAMQSGNLRRIGNSLMAVGSSSLHTTTGDLLKWVQNLDDRILGSVAVHSLMGRQGQLGDSMAIPYGFGLIHGTYRGLDTVTHSGEWAGFRSAILRIPDHRFAVIVLGNDASLNASVMAERIAEYYLEAFMDPLPEPFFPALREAFLPGDYEGIYDFGGSHLIHLTAEENTLFAQLPPAESIPVQLLGTDSLGIPALGITLTFTRNSHGQQVTKASSGVRTAVRLPLLKKTDMSSFEGCYKSEELDTSYIIQVQDDMITATGPRGKKIALRKATPSVFTSNLWYMPVIRFYASSDAKTVTRFETSSPRNWQVVFKKGC